MTSIYIIEGQSGEYEDYRTWVVKSYESAADAQKEADRMARVLAEYREKVTADPFPEDHDAFDRWDKRRMRREKKYVALMGEYNERLDSDTVYQVVQLPFFGESAKAVGNDPMER